ncbi:MAG: hypothetical protein LUD03_03230 [Firmicutes bacterium]|nr:hypothetical protein [Bacillota bacterium]
MSHSGFMKGMAAGMAVGAAVTLMVDSPSKQKHKMSKKAEGLFMNIGSAIDSAMGMRG